MNRGDRRRPLDELYRLLDLVGGRVGGARRLGEASGRDGWPSRGVYFFFEPGELREDGLTPRVVRVGTHALTAPSKADLWTRLRAHRGLVGGREPGGGNHRGSVFRLHVGTALINRDGHREAAATWGRKSHAPREVRDREVKLERAVSACIGAMSVLWVDVPTREQRAVLEQGCIALLSNYDRDPIDPASHAWLGHHADRAAVRRSGLWNVNHVTDPPDSAAVDLPATFVHR